MIVLPNARLLVSPPSEEPITLQTAKTHCVVTHTLDDSNFTNIWIPAARFQAEKLSGEYFLTQQWEFTFPGFPVGIGFPSRRQSLEIPAKPVQTLDSIEYIDEAGNLQTYGTFAGSPLVPVEYTLVRDTKRPYIALNVNQNWPVAARVDNAVKIKVTVGYEDTAADFALNTQTQLFRAGMLLLIAHFNENREAVIATDFAAAVEIPLGIRQLLAKPKVG